MTLSEKLSKIQEEFKSKKSRFNSFGKYNFRSAEDILEALKPFNAKYGITLQLVNNYSTIVCFLLLKAPLLYQMGKLNKGFIYCRG